MIDYSKYGVDSSAASDANIAKNRAVQAAIEAVNADIAVIIETDEEDRAILEGRRDELKARAEDLRREAKLTKGEINGYRTQVIQGKRVELAQTHLNLEARAKALEAAGDLAKVEREEQKQIEHSLSTLDQL